MNQRDLDPRKVVLTEEDKIRYLRCIACCERFPVADDLLVAGFWCPRCRKAGHGADVRSPP